MQLPGEFSPVIEKKVFFCLVVGGVTPPPYTLSGPTTKKNTFFMCVFPYSRRVFLSGSGYILHSITEYTLHKTVIVYPATLYCVPCHYVLCTLQQCTLYPATMYCVAATMYCVPCNNVLSKMYE